MRIDHIAVAVNSLDEAVANYQRILKVDHLEVEVVHNEKVRVAMLELEDTRMELMEPTAEDSPIKKFLIDRGEGIHHIAITADDIEKDISRATANGMKILGGLRVGSYGRKITFIHPKSINGVLMEFCEAPTPRE
jgi:methylmalonyl-CoA/ethylmalonyl-CoA epimerase